MNKRTSKLRKSMRDLPLTAKLLGAMAPLFLVSAVAAQLSVNPADHLSGEPGLGGFAEIGLITACMLVLTFLFVRRLVVLPARQIVEGLHEVARGNLGHRLENDCGGDMGRMKEQFNRVVGELRYSQFTYNTVIEKQRRLVEELEILNSDLEQKVRERTWEAEESRRKAETEAKRLDDIVTTLGAGLSIVDRNMNIVWVNRLMQHWFGGLEEIKGKKCYEVFRQSPEVCECCPAAITLMRGTTEKGLQSAVTRRAEKRQYLLTSTPIFDEDGKVIQALELLQDITEKQEMEQKLVETNRRLMNTNKELKGAQAQLVQSGKMAAIGQLAAGVAHELNQPLSGIRGFVQLIMSELEDSGLYEKLKLIEQQTQRMSGIINNLRSFARQSKSEHARIEVASVLEKALMLLSPQLRNHDISVTLEIPDRVPDVDANENELQQVFLNVLMNAIDAVNENQVHREIRVGLSVAGISDPSCGCDKFVLLDFSDNGPGIDPAVRDRIFDPFFTTKEVGRGTGLGLSIAHAIIRNHGGLIDAVARPHGGASMRIALPSVEARPCWEINPESCNERRRTGNCIVFSNGSFRACWDYLESQKNGNSHHVPDRCFECHAYKRYVTLGKLIKENHKWALQRQKSCWSTTRK